MKKIGLFVLLTAGLLGQAQAGGWSSDAMVGGALGGATGAAVGSAVGGRDAAIVGGLLGGAVGVAMATHYNQPRERVIVRRDVVQARPGYGYGYGYAPRVYGPPHGYAYGHRMHGYGPYGHGPRPVYRGHYGY